MTKYKSLNSITDAMCVSDYMGSIGRIGCPLLHLPLKSNLDMVCGKGSVTFTRASNATYIDRYGVVQKVSNDTPRFEKEGLLIEGSGTNLLTYSEDFDNSAWIKHECSISANTITAPDGTTTADGIVATTNDTSHYAYERYDTSATTLSSSCFMKAGNKNWVRIIINFYDSSNSLLQASLAYFNVSTGDVGTITNIDSHNIVELASGWGRYGITATYNGASTVDHVYAIYTAADSDGDYTFAGDGSTINTYVWGAQLEEFPHSTSYIHTTSASATRAADICYFQFEGNMVKELEDMTLIVDADSTGPIPNDCYLLEHKGYNTFSMKFEHSNDKIRFYNTGRPLENPIVSQFNQKYRIGSTCDGSNVKLYIDGELKDTDTTHDKTYDPTQPIYLGYHPSTYTGYGHISNLRIYDVALTEEEMKIA